MPSPPRRLAPAIMLAAALAAAAAAQAQEPPYPEPNAFLAESLKGARSNDLVRSYFTFIERETRYTHDSSGRVVRKQVRVYEVHPHEDPELTYRRLVSVNGVEPKDLAKRDADQKKKVQEWTAAEERQGQSAREARRRRAAEEDRREQAVVNEITSIYDFRIVARETIDGRPCIVFTFTPRASYAPRTPEGRILKSFAGRTWIDEHEYQLTRLKVEALETVSVKWGFIFRLLKGSRGHIERRKLDGKNWLPTYSRFTGSGRILFIARVDLDQETEFLSYRPREPGQ